MSRFHFSLVLLLAGLTAASPAGASGPIKLLALGDSYTAGTSVTTAEAWPAQLVALLKKESRGADDATVIARNGWTTDELMAGIDAAHPEGPFDIVTVMIGVNDQYRGGTAAEFRPKFESVVRRAIGLAGNDPSHVILITIPDYSITPFAKARDPRKISAMIHQFNYVILQVKRKYNTRISDVVPIFQQAVDNPSLLAEDGLHPSARMHGGWAVSLRSAAQEVLRNIPMPKR